MKRSVHKILALLFLPLLMVSATGLPIFSHICFDIGLVQSSVLPLSACGDDEIDLESFCCGTLEKSCCTSNSQSSEKDCCDTFNQWIGSDVTVFLQNLEENDLEFSFVALADYPFGFITKPYPLLLEVPSVGLENKPAAVISQAFLCTFLI